MENIINICKKAYNAKSDLNKLTTIDKNAVLRQLIINLQNNKATIINENKKDIAFANENNLKESFIKRLILTEDSIDGICSSIEKVINLSDPIGQFESNTTLENGLIVGKKTVPLGVIGVIYESRPNVTIDVFTLCFKASSVSILKGGKEAYNSNLILHKIIQDTLVELGFNPDFCQLLTTDREGTTFFMNQKEYVDLLIPRGSQTLINAVSENSKIPVIETGVGNCHLYVDNEYNIESAIKIIINGKTQRPDVCNALENLIIHKDIAQEILPIINDKLTELGVTIKGDKHVQKIINCEFATDDDFYTEYLDLVISIKIVDNIDMAIEHINNHSTSHSEVIISENYTNVQRFLNEIDSAVVYANASSRFTDGEQFGFGSEIGISTQKLHARGPMGLKEITTTKYVVYGDGHTRT